MAVTTSATGPAVVGRRRRRGRDEARREILEAASELLSERPAHAVTVAAIMDRTTLSRKSFYVYFADRAELIEALVRPLRADTDAALQRWRAAEDPVVAGRAALSSAAHFYRRHSAILRALFWSSVDDRELAAAQAALIDPVVSAAESIINDADTGLADAHATATALVTMNVHRMLTLTPHSSDAEIAALVNALATIWERTIYPLPANGRAKSP